MCLDKFQQLLYLKSFWTVRPAEARHVLSERTGTHTLENLGTASRLCKGGAALDISGWVMFFFFFFSHVFGVCHLNGSKCAMWLLVKAKAKDVRVLGDSDTILLSVVFLYMFFRTCRLSQHRLAAHGCRIKGCRRGIVYISSSYSWEMQKPPPGQHLLCITYGRAFLINTSSTPEYLRLLP